MRARRSRKRRRACRPRRLRSRRRRNLRQVAGDAGSWTTALVGRRTYFSSIFVGTCNLQFKGICEFANLEVEYLPTEFGNIVFVNLRIHNFVYKNSGKLCNVEQISLLRSPTLGRPFRRPKRMPSLKDPGRRRSPVQTTGPGTARIRPGSVSSRPRSKVAAWRTTTFSSNQGRLRQRRAMDPPLRSEGRLNAPMKTKKRAVKGKKRLYGGAMTDGAAAARSATRAAPRPKTASGPRTRSGTRDALGQPRHRAPHHGRAQPHGGRCR